MIELIYDDDTFGITINSLKMLRNEIAKRLDHVICVLQIATGDITCGYLIHDKTDNVLIWTGDGFRTDGGGEGGAGFKTVIALFHLWGNRTLEISYQELIAECKQLEADYLDINKFINVVWQRYEKEIELFYFTPSENVPIYLRGL